MSSDLSLKNRIPPHNQDAEQATLGALLLNFKSEVLDTVTAYLRADDFFKPAHQHIFEGILSLSGNGEAIDILTITDYLRSQTLLEKSGGAPYIITLTNAVPSSANIEFYAKIVQECSIRRQLLLTSGTIAVSAHDESRETGLIIEEAERKIFELNDKQQTGSFRSAQEVIQQTVEQIEKRYRTKENYTGIPSGYADLDNLTSGFQNSEMVIIGARPSVGKTALALSIAGRIAVHDKIPCGFFTLEMPATALMERIVAAEAKINSKTLRTGLLRPADFNKLTEAAGRIYEAPLYIDDTPNMKLLDLRSQARRMVTKHGVKILIIDYIGLIMSEDKFIPRHEQIADVSRSLKSLARELDIPIIALSQVGRQSEGKAPGLADLRESGSIEQDADMVMFLHRDRGIEQGTDSNNESDVIETDLIIAKNRNGPVGIVKLAFIPQFTKFEAMSYTHH